MSEEKELVAAKTLNQNEFQLAKWLSNVIYFIYLGRSGNQVLMLCKISPFLFTFCPI